MNSSGGADQSSGEPKNLLLGLKPSSLIGIVLGCFICIWSSILDCCCCFVNHKHRGSLSSCSGLVPMITKEIVDIKSSEPDRQEKIEFIEEVIKKEVDEKIIRIGIESSVQSNSPSVGSQSSCSVLAPEVLIGWGRWYTFRELEIATDGFSKENVIGEGGYGIVYRGVLPDNSLIAIKNLFNNKGQANQEFKVEVEAIGKVRHKNLVGLIGYCVEGAQRMLIYEYVNNGNLEQWLHGDVGPSSPLTWDIRMKIAIGTAKGLAYLHEGLEPKVVHRDIKSSNILLDQKWNPKVSDFGLAKLLGSEASYVTTRVMGTFGYVAPEYASSGRLNEGSDVFSFGVLLMEIISGRSPVDYSRPPGEINLIDWFRMMVANQRGEDLLDPRIEIQPSLRALKRVFLICLRCIDWNANKRPKMGQVVHMLEADDFPFRAEHWTGRDGANLSPVTATVITDKAPSLAETKAER